MQTNVIQQALGHLTLGEAQYAHNLSVYPLLADHDGEPGYLTLDQALSEHQARVTEASEAGRVPELAFENLADEPILLLDGEEQEFRSGGRALYSRARASKMQQVSESLRSSGTRRSDQGAIWDDIAFKMREHSEASRIQAMADIHVGAEDRLASYDRAFTHVPGQVGAVFAINGQIAGMELFGAPAASAAYLPKLVRSYGMDAIDAPLDVPAVVEPETIRQFLKQLASANQARYPGAGAGEDVRIDGEVIAGGALEHDGQLAHLAAYRIASRNRANTGEFTAPMARSSYRRRLH